MASKKEISMEDKLMQLAELQEIHSKVDQIQVLKGELPIEVADLEDEIAGLETRLSKVERDVASSEELVQVQLNNIKEAQALIGKYERQLDTVKNNREFDALTKEIELQRLDIQLAEKRIREAKFLVESSSQTVQEGRSKIDMKRAELDIKKAELDRIIAETEKEENELTAKADAVQAKVEERLLNAYKRIRTSYRNGLAVVMVERGACGGCFGRIPPQTQAEIKLKKKILTCEHCGRILVDVSEVEQDADIIPATAMID
jgi:predicted  nucleic acid-binding Zn-ribbon protein